MELRTSIIWVLEQIKISRREGKDTTFQRGWLVGTINCLFETKQIDQKKYTRIYNAIYKTMKVKVRR